ncbi:hypothetical protein DFQ28_000702, partial [Apophysomyces sp. BC1034]
RETIDELYNTLHGKYLKKNLRIGDKLLLDIANVIRDVVQNGKSRRKAQLDLLQLADAFQEDDCILIDIICNCLQKLPVEDAQHEIAEMELLTTYLDPVLSAMLHKPDEGRIFRWINQLVSEYGADPGSLRPDGLMSLDPDNHQTFALGFCEVKPKNAEKRYQDTHLDTLRIAMFCKDALDKGEIQCTLGVQTVDVYNVHCVRQSSNIDKLRRPSVPFGQLIQTLNSTTPPNFKPTLRY